MKNFEPKEKKNGQKVQEIVSEMAVCTVIERKEKKISFLFNLPKL